MTTPAEPIAIHLTFAFTVLPALAFAECYDISCLRVLNGISTAYNERVSVLSVDAFEKINRVVGNIQEAQLSQRGRAMLTSLNNSLSLKVTQGHWKWHHLIHRIWVPMAFHRNYVLSCIISEIKLDIGRKSRFCVPHLHSMLQLGWSSSEYRHSVWKN